VLELHMRQVLRTDAVTLEQRLTGRAEDTRDAAIAFADIVGFTALGETVPVEELSGVAGRLSRAAGDVADPPVRVVKQIGDAVMLVSAEAGPLVDAALRLVALGEDGGELPPLRAGIAFGPAVNRWGDWFGSPVNVASRLTARARPASVLVTEAVRDAAGDGYRWSAAGEKRLKGLPAPVKTYRARRSAAEA
jgi:adenylate cyclase